MGSPHLRNYQIFDLIGNHFPEMGRVLGPKRHTFLIHVENLGCVPSPLLGIIFAVISPRTSPSTSLETAHVWAASPPNWIVRERG